MYYVYVLRSRQCPDKFYIGSTNDLKARFVIHNNGKVFSTKRYTPWNLIYYEAYETEKLARTREQKLKYHGNAMKQLKKRILENSSLSHTKNGAGHVKKVLSFWALIFSFSAGKVFAATNSVPGANMATWEDCIAAGTKDVATLACIPIVLQNLINFLALFAGVIAVFLLMYAGFKFTTSQGDPEKVATARRTMIFVLWGSLIIVFSFAIVNLIAQFTGVTSLAPKP